ncbi:hypothetical protein M3O75_10905 [Klebsiella pneumoniae]|nr:hypothetical protein [Klebsiella pneumoniae]
MTLATRTVTLPGGLQATGPSAAGGSRGCPARVAGGSHHEPSRFLGWRTCWNICCFTAESATRMMTD